MTDHESVTDWLNQLKQGESLAAHRPWDRYQARQLNLARNVLGKAPRGIADEEDVALSAFETFCKRAVQGRFSQLEDRNDLWKILAKITARKASRLAKRERGEEAKNSSMRLARPQPIRHPVRILLKPRAKNWDACSISSRIRFFGLSPTANWKDSRTVKLPAALTSPFLRWNGSSSPFATCGSAKSIRRKTRPTDHSPYQIGRQRNISAPSTPPRKRGI